MQTRLTHSKIGVIIMNQQGVISSANAAFANLVGYKEDKIIDANISRFFPAEANTDGTTARGKKKSFSIMDKIKGDNPIVYANITTKDKVKLPVEIVAIKLSGDDSDFFVCTIKSTLLQSIEKEINKLIQKITVFAMQCNSETQIAPFLCSALVKILDLESAWVGVRKTNGDLTITGTFGEVPSSITQGRSIRWSNINQEMPNISFCLQHLQTSVRSAAKDAPNEGAQVISIPLLFCKEPVGIIEIQTKKDPLSPEIMDGLEFAAERFALILKMATDQEHINLLVTAISSAANGVFITDTEGNIIWIARDFHDAIETIYSVQTAHLKIGESVELPVLGLRNRPRIFASETAEYQAYIKSIDCLASGNPAEKLELLEINRAARRRLAEQASHHNPDKVALSSQCKMNFNQAKAPLNIFKTVSTPAVYTKDCRFR